MNISVKSTANCHGMPPTFFQALSPTWTGQSVVLPFGKDRRRLTVIGWSHRSSGTACPIHVTKSRYRGLDGYLVHGGNSGVRILDDDANPIPGLDEHLPRGWGQAIIWVEEVADLPPEVRAVVEHQASPTPPISRRGLPGKE